MTLDIDLLKKKTPDAENKVLKLEKSQEKHQ